MPVLDMSEKPKILIVEDEKAILQGLIDVFVFHGFEVDHAMDGELGLDKALNKSYDLILLDVMLPLLDGFSLCNRIREKDLQLPIVMLTAKSTEQDIITGLTLGADDYISKPFSVRELVLRVQSVLKRTQQQIDQNEIIDVGLIQIDTVNLQQINASPPLSFTHREIEILHFLQQHGNRPVTREELLEQVWGYRQPQFIETRTVDIHIAKLRRKIEQNPKKPKFLVTVRGQGYRLLAHATE
jgi:two-component system response regulator RegX3